MHITVYTKPGCHLCDEALHLLDKLTGKYRLQVAEVNILDDMAVYEQYKHMIPVIKVSDVHVGRLIAPITEPEMNTYFSMAGDAMRGRGSGVGDQSHGPPDPRPPTPDPFQESRFDRFATWVGRHWLRMACIALAIFVTVPWLAPIFAALGWWDFANPIYTAYALTCHQLPERSGMVMGYQVAFCYRNTALYGGVPLFGLVFGLARDRSVARVQWLKSQLPWWGLVLFLIPIAIDGVTHMLGLRDTFDWMTDSSFGSFYIGSQPFSFNWWLRIITGLLAALGVVWFAFPRMQKSVEDAERLRRLYKQQAAMVVQRRQEQEQQAQTESAE